MDKHPPSRAAAIVVVVFLLLPVLYVGSYLALVVPGTLIIVPQLPPGQPGQILVSVSRPWTFTTYRYGGDWFAQFFWPLEQIDRQVRPAAWVFDPQF